MTRLSNYLNRLEAILDRRSDISISSLSVGTLPQVVVITAEIHFLDGSRLTILEHLEATRDKPPKRIRYKYHYQSVGNELIFRYDDSPHHPHLSTFPHHKHINQEIIETQPPDLADVLAEIDQLLYGTK